MQEAEIKIESDDFSSRDVGNALIHKLIPLFRWYLLQVQILDEIETEAETETGSAAETKVSR